MNATQGKPARRRTPCLRLSLVFLALAGCGRQGEEHAVRTAESDQLLLNEFVDGQMDALDAALHQQEPQEPPLAIADGAITPSGEISARPAGLTAEETRSVLGEAVRLAEAGQLDDALHALSTHDPDASLRAKWLARRAELLALRFEVDGVRPLAARFAAFALQQDAASGAAALRRALREEWAWAWRYEGARAAVVIPMSSAEGSGPSSGGQAFFHVQGYTNMDIPRSLEHVHRPLEHFHFAVFLVAARSYIASYTVQSRELLGGERVFFLQRQIGGRPDVLKVYEEAPDYETAAADTQAHLEGIASLGSS